jgi:FlaG/FlaF family flagellin (archaellin)
MSANSPSPISLVDARRPADRGVSAVVGIALLVGITVLLVTVIAGFVLAFSGPSQAAPQSDFFFDHTELDSGGTYIVVTHLSGESIPAGQLDIVVQGVDGGPTTWSWEDLDVDIDEDNPNAARTLVVGGDAAGGAVTIEGESATVQVRWSADDSDQTYILEETEVPA